MLMDMEMAYRSFERSLVGYMLVAVGKNDRL